MFSLSNRFCNFVHFQNIHVQKKPLSHPEAFSAGDREDLSLSFLEGKGKKKELQSRMKGNVLCYLSLSVLLKFIEFSGLKYI